MENVLKHKYGLISQKIADTLQTKFMIDYPKNMKKLAGC